MTVHSPLPVADCRKRRQADDPHTETRPCAKAHKAKTLINRAQTGDSKHTEGV